MAIEVTRVPYGEPAVAVLADRVRAAKAGDPLAPVTVVVPSNYAAVATRRELARRGGVVGVSFLTVYRLAERVGGPTLAAAGRRPVSAPVVLQAIRAALAEAPGVLVSVADHPATELALAAAQRELAGVSAEALDAVAAQSPRANTVVRIARMATERLRVGWHDEHDLLVAATIVLRRGCAHELGPVIFHLPERAPAGEAEFLHALAARGPLTLLVGATGVDQADHPVVAAVETAGFLVPPLAGVERPRARRVVSASDPDEETRIAVRLVVEAAREGVPLGRMAVFFGAANPYARLIREHLEAAGIAANGTPVRTVGDMLVGRLVRGLLGLPDRAFRRSEVLAILSSTMMRDGPGHHAPVRAWDRVSRAAGVVEGDDWADRLVDFAAERIRKAAAAEDDERPGLASRFRHESDRALSLASFVAELMAVLVSGDALSTWQELAAWASGLLDRYLGDNRSGWPEPEREAAERVGTAIERLGALDALAGPPPTVQVFRRLLDGELDVALQRIGRLGEGVLVGPLSLAVGLTLDRVVVVGLAEGTFPDRRLDDSLLPDRERAVTNGQLALRAEHVHDNHRHLLAALAAGPATVCFPRGDLRQPGARLASRWLLDDATALAHSTSRVFTADLEAYRGAAWLDIVPSFTAGLSRQTFPATSQEHRLAALLRDHGALPARALTLTDPILAAGAALAEARRCDAFTRFDGNLAGLDLVPVVSGDRAHSATRLQAWAVCPHAYLLEHVLGVEVVDEPERRLRIDALDKGALVHEVLRRFVEDGCRSADQLQVIGAQVSDEFAARGRTGRQLFWRRDRARILTDLDRFFIDDDAWRMNAGAEPVAAERRFDTMLQLPDGGRIRVRGAIDRIDRLADGSLVVFDYKTGRAEPYRDLSAEAPHQRGTRLQPVIYAAGARDEVGGSLVRFDYWFVTSTGGFERIGYEVSGAVATAVGVAVGIIVDGISRGLFPLRPQETPAWNGVDCWFCSPDGLSTAEARRDWERKRGDPLLAAYVDLCEPGSDDDHR